MKKVMKSLLITLIYALAAFYFSLPAINLKSKSFYMYVISVIVVYLIVSFLCGVRLSHISEIQYQGIRFKGLKTSTKILGAVIVVAAVVLVGGEYFFKRVFPRQKVSAADGDRGS